MLKFINSDVLLFIKLSRSAQISSTITSQQNRSLLFSKQSPRFLALHDTSEHDTFEPDSKKLAAGYCPVNIQTVVQNYTHLSQDQRNSLASVINDFTDMFDGKLKHFPDEEIHLDINLPACPHR